ncbi:hypothetical protein ACIRPT_37000 [Streptomyces sp. NPDC101227]|uniref:hypothetical protein n=1 Tax=Streptomyces sp. NPDC101227 TaxID=3366136 RepID=UPI0038100807
MTLDNYGVREENWREALNPHRTRTNGLPAHRQSSPSRSHHALSAEAAAALAADPERRRWNQRSVSSAQMAREYGVTDIDDRQPDSRLDRLGGAGGPCGGACLHAEGIGAQVRPVPGS